MGLNSELLDRFDISVDNKVIIEISITELRNLFSSFEYSSAFYKRDLNERLESYLLECVGEIGLKHPSVLRLGIPQGQVEAVDEGNIIIGFKRYFDYCILLSGKEIRATCLRMIFHLALALTALSIAMYFSLDQNNVQPGVFNMFVSGLPVAAGVLIVTGLSRFFFRIKTQVHDMRTYGYLKNTPLEFKYY